MRGTGGRSLVERLLGGAIMLLAAALAVRYAVEVFLSVVWPLIGIAVVVAVSVGLWRLWRYRRDGF